jgi:hypothetical protein
MIQLQQLIAVRETRLQAAQAELRQALTALAEVEHELGIADDELRQVRDQKALWEGQWQHWLRQDGVLYRGQAYNLRHITLASWEADVLERRTKIKELHQTMLAEVQRVRTIVLKLQQRVDLLRERFTKLNKIRQRRRTDGIDTEALEEITLHGWTTRQSVLSRGP